MFADENICFRCLRRETDEKKLSGGWIESKVVRRHPERNKRNS